VLGIIFIGFGLLSFKKPKTALLIPLVLLTSYYLFLLVLSPYHFWQGILWKTIIMVLLGYGYYSVRRADRILKKYNYISDILEEESLKS